MSPANLRAELAADLRLGAGNVLLMLAEHGGDPDVPRVTFDVDVDGIPAWTPLSLRDLTERVAARADWYAGRGIGPRDPDCPLSASMIRPPSRFDGISGQCMLRKCFRACAISSRDRGSPA